MCIRDRDLIDKTSGNREFVIKNTIHEAIKTEERKYAEEIGVEPVSYTHLREVCRNQGENGCTDCPIAKAFDRLAAYEETGLEPEELAQAKKKGRLVVLPCSIGDPVFMGTGRYKITGYEEDVCDGFYIGRDGVLQVKAQNYNGNHGTYGVIGQTAELTREAAEAALKEKEAEHESNV